MTDGFLFSMYAIKYGYDMRVLKSSWSTNVGAEAKFDRKEFGAHSEFMWIVEGDDQGAMTGHSSKWRAFPTTLLHSSIHTKNP